MPTPDLPATAAITYRRQYTRCGKADCARCANGNPGHGPYWYAYWREGGRVRSRYLGKQAPPAAQGADGAEAAPLGPAGPAQAPVAADASRAARPATPAVATAPQALPPLRVRTLGGLAISRGEQPLAVEHWGRKKAVALFLALLEAPGHRVHREQAADLLWPDADVDLAAANLRATVHLLRKALDSADATASYLQTDGDWLALLPAPGAEPPADWWDAAAFASAAAAALSGREAGACRAALALYTCDHLPGEPEDSPASARRDALRARRLALLQHLAGLCEDQQDHAEARRSLEQLLDLDPANEAAARRLMRLLAAAGALSDAAQVYRRLHETMQDELGIAPERETTALYQTMVLSTAANAPPSLDGIAAPIQPPLPGTVASPSPPLVLGRSLELALIYRSLAALPEGTGGILGISGTAGIGKTRLLQEAARLALGQGALVLWGETARTGQPPGASTPADARSVTAVGVVHAIRPGTRIAGAKARAVSPPFGPFLDALRRYALTQRPEVLAAQVGLHSGALSELLPELANLPFHPAPSSPNAPTDRHRLLTALADFCAAICRAQPTLLVLDDLHEADADTVHALHYLARTLRGAPLLLLLAFRPEEVRPGSPPAALTHGLRHELPGATLLTLEPLPDYTVHALVQILLAPSPVEPALQEEIAAQAAGYPLFAASLVSTLREQGHIHVRTGCWRRAEDTEWPVPAAALDLVTQRLGTLDEHAALLAAICAAQGPDVAYSTLHRASGLDEEDLLDALESLSAASLVAETPRGYSIVHPLLGRAIAQAVPADTLHGVESKTGTGDGHG